MNNKSLSFRDVRGHLLRAVANSKHGLRIVRAIPVAFPIIEPTFEVLQRLPFSIGLANRFVLEAVSKFGPCTVEELNGLLGLGEDVIANVLRDAESYNMELKSSENHFFAGEIMRASLAEDKFSKLVEHQYRFVVNGVTGTLLPISFWKWRDEFRITVRFDEGGETIEDADGNKLALRAWLLGHGATGAEELKRLISTPEASEKDEIGVPAGAFALKTQYPVASASSWVLAFVFVLEDSTLEVTAAGEGSLSLLAPGYTDPIYWRKACRGTEFRPWLLDAEWRDEDLHSLEGIWPEGTNIEPGNGRGELLISVPFPHQNLVWKIASDDDKANERIRLREALIEGVLWNPYTCNLHLLRAGDEATASHVCVLRAVRELRRKLRKLDMVDQENSPFDMGEWWMEWQRNFYNGENNVEPGKLSLRTLFEVAEEVDDTEFLDKLDWLQEMQL